jgi:SAM-dependent methyltransferase
VDGRYYAQKLSAERLRRCYELAPPRVRRYLEAEIEYVLDRIGPGDTVLELGCGYGRVLGRMAERARRAVGIDTSPESLRLAGGPNVALALMDAAALGFRPKAFDVVACVQNGVSAFGVDRRTLIGEALRVTRPGGTALFSSYAAAFWDHRLEWFRRQSGAGLLGEIDEGRTGDGVIVCRDGFRVETVGEEGFRELTRGLAAEVRLTVVDSSSLFCELTRTRE